MTGLDCLREEMEKRGCTKSQIESKTAAVVLDILANTDTVHADIVQAEVKLSEIRREYDKFSQDLKWAKLNLEQSKKELTSRFEKAREYIEKFNAALSDCETPDGRDAMKRAQMFVNSVTVDTKFDNTAFIIGLAAILSDGEIGAIDELRKVNPKLFEQPRKRY